MSARVMKLTVLTLTLIGSPTPVIAQSRCVTSQNHVLINSSIQRHNGARDLLQFLERHVSTYRLSLAAHSPDDQPYVMIDGVGISGGVQRLADIPVDHVISVTTLRPADAAFRFGTRAHRGAILVTTKSGPAMICSRPLTNPR